MLPVLTCPALEKLEQLVTGELSQEELDQLAAHLERCTTCADKLEDMPAFRDGFAAVCRDIRAARRYLTEILVAPAAPIAHTEASLFPQRVGRYRLEEQVGGGAMGRIIRVTDETFDRALAMKILRTDRGTSAAAEQRFLREARLTGQMQHPGIPPVQDLGRLDDGRPYYVMKLVKGRSLEAMLEGRSFPGQELPRYVAIFEQVCQTLAYAHSRNVIHRDLKPENIMVGAFGEVQVMDWGLAKLIAGPGKQPEPAADAGSSGTVFDLPTTASERTTASGAVMGTPAYMPPEQARGEIEDLNQRSDVFGLGGILCTILCGKPPFVGSSALRQSKQGAVADAFGRLDGCGADLELIALAKKCLAPNRMTAQHTPVPSLQRLAIIKPFCNSACNRQRSTRPPPS
jgi:serine/threonine protein kinase